MLNLSAIMIDKNNIVEALKKVSDPELGMDIWSLGLVYDIKIEGKNVIIVMSLTSPSCPYGDALMDDVRRQVSSVEGVGEAEIELTFDPPWGPEKMSEEARMALGV